MSKKRTKYRANEGEGENDVEDRCGNGGARDENGNGSDDCGADGSEELLTGGQGGALPCGSTAADVSGGGDNDDNDEDSDDESIDVKVKTEPSNDDEQTKEERNKQASKEKKKKKVRKLRPSATADFNAALARRGVLYVARVPPRMTPSKIKNLLSDFGEVTRVYLAEEDKVVRKKRKRNGGSGSKRYVEGWVEFESKSVAKRVGGDLNNSRVTSHKRSVHHDDLWNVKYLRGFKWSHLTEKVAYERRVREQKLRVEMMEVRRENAAFSREVEAGKKLDRIEERRRKRQNVGGTGGDDKGNTGRGGRNTMEEEYDGMVVTKKRKFFQKKPFQGDSNASAKPALLGSLV